MELGILVLACGNPLQLCMHMHLYTQLKYAQVVLHGLPRADTTHPSSSVNVCLISKENPCFF